MHSPRERSSHWTERPSNGRTSSLPAGYVRLLLAGCGLVIRQIEGPAPSPTSGHFWGRWSPSGQLAYRGLWCNECRMWFQAPAMAHHIGELFSEAIAMRTRHLTRMVVVLTATALVAALAATAASARSGVGGQVISVIGQSNSRPDLTVDIMVYVPRGQSASDAAAAALQSQNAHAPFPSYLGSDGFTLNSVLWPGFGATNQAYWDDGNDPIFTNLEVDLANVQAQWSNVTGSTFDVNSAGADAIPAIRCPSLIPECNPTQPIDGENGIAWVTFGGRPNVVGVAWSIASDTPEVDIALNLKFKWNRVSDPAAMALAVLLHEEGHFVGGGHSRDNNSVMWSSISSNSPTTTLTTDDKEIARFKYPAARVAVEGFVVLDDGDNLADAVGATVSLAGTGLTDDTDEDGFYSISGVPDNVHYDVVATLNGDSASRDQQLVSGADPFGVALLTIVVSGGDDGGGGGGGPPFCAGGANPTHPACS